MNDRENHDRATHRFIALANEMKEEGLDIKLISAALMASSGIYATYVAAGNNGALQPSGVDKVVNIYRSNLEHIQQRKREDLEAQTNQ
jgi:cell fate regulator YaaT (PSP1 superfamily)